MIEAESVGDKPAVTPVRETPAGESPTAEQASQGSFRQQLLKSDAGKKLLRKQGLLRR